MNILVIHGPNMIVLDKRILLFTGINTIDEVNN